MELAIPTWILVIFLSVALLVFLILGIILLVKLIDMTKEAKKIIITGQGIGKCQGYVEYRRACQTLRKQLY